MRKKNFIGPFWWVVVLGVFYVLSIVVTALTGMPEGVGFVLLSLLWIGVLGFEAVVYWRIRKRNEARKESWAHVVALGFTFLVPVFRGAMIEALFGEVFGEQIGKEMGNYFAWEQTAVYWTLMGLAHVFFGRVVWKAYKARRAVGDAASTVGDAALAGGNAASAGVVGEDRAPAKGGVGMPGVAGASASADVEGRGVGEVSLKEKEKGTRPPTVGITILPEPEQKDLLDDIWN